MDTMKGKKRPSLSPRPDREQRLGVFNSLQGFDQLPRSAKKRDDVPSGASFLVFGEALPFWHHRIGMTAINDQSEHG